MSRASWASMQLHARKSAFLSLSTSVIALSLLPPTALQAAEDTPGLQRAPAASQQDIIVTASPLQGARDNFATIVERVDRAEILKQGGANLADALRDVPGVTGTGFASGASRPVIRGFDANRVRILENGVGSFDVSDIGPDHGVPIDPLAAQSIEVVRGAATLRYGSQAIGGVVNALNNRIPLALPGKALSGELDTSYGLNGDAKQGAGLIDARLGALAVHADGFGRHVEDYNIPGGRQDNSFFEGSGYALGSSYFFGDKSRIGGAFIRYDAKYGIPAGTSFIDMKQSKGLFGTSLAIDKHAFQTLNVDAGYADYQHSEIEPGEGPISTFKDREWDGRAEAVFGAFGPFSGAAFGTQVQNRQFSALGEGADYLLPTQTDSVAGFGFAESQLSETLKLELGVRVERVDVEGTPLSDVVTVRHFTPLSGAAGLVFDASEHVRLGLTLSSTARAPSQTELFARGAHDGPRTFETGDPTLGIERANALEATIRAQFNGIKLEGAVWGALFQNYIFGRLTGLTCNDEGTCAAEGGELRQLFYEQRDARFFGLEAKGSFDLLTAKTGGVLSALLKGDYVRAQFDGGENVPRIPPYRIGAGFSWTENMLDAGIMLTYSGRQDAAGFGETETGDFLSLDMQIAVRPFETYRNVEVSIIGHNLTDDVQRNAVAFNKDEVILPGRDVKFAVRLLF